MPRRTPLVIGHRGAPAYRPEHSRSSYDLAFAMGVDAVEPDVVVSKDGVLVVRHENEISGTTDVADRPEFADRRATKMIDGAELTGWFTEDFTWDELSTLRCRERLPKLRPSSATFDDEQPVLRLRDVLDLVRAASLEQGRELGVVLEIKHATYFSSIGWDVAALVAAELRRGRVEPRSTAAHDRGVRVDRVAAPAGTRHPGDLHLPARGRRPSVRPDRRARQGGAHLSRRPRRRPDSMDSPASSMASASTRR